MAAILQPAVCVARSCGCIKACQRRQVGRRARCSSSLGPLQHLIGADRTSIVCCARSLQTGGRCSGLDSELGIGPDRTSMRLSLSIFPPTHRALKLMHSRSAGQPLAIREAVFLTREAES